MRVYCGKGYAYHATTRERSLDKSSFADVTHADCIWDIYQLLKLRIIALCTSSPLWQILRLPVTLRRPVTGISGSDLSKLSRYRAAAKSRNAKSIWIRVVGEDQRKSLKPHAGKNEAWEIHVRFFNTIISRRRDSPSRWSLRSSGS